jgi:hypothetical protein
MSFKKSPSAPQAPGRLAGGEPTEYRSPKLFQPTDQGFVPAPFQGKFLSPPVPVVFPPANLRCHSRTKIEKLLLEIYIFYPRSSFASDSDKQNSRHTCSSSKRFIFLLAAFAQTQGLLKRCPFMGFWFPGSGIERLGGPQIEERKRDRK